MERAVCEIFKCLIINAKHKAEKQAKSDCLEGNMFMSIDAKNSRIDVNQLHASITIAVVGELSADIDESLHKEIRALLTNYYISLDVQHKEVFCPHENLGITSFQLSFEVRENMNELMLDCLAVKRFLHRISIVNPKVKMHYCIKMNNRVSSETFGSKKKEKIFYQNGIYLSTDSEYEYFRENFHCTKIHPVNNEIVNLLIPNEAAETGLSGELQLVPIAALDPCLKMYPNRPAQISEISIFVYSTLGLPVLIHSRKKPLPFFEDSVHVAEWLMFNSDVKLHLDTIQEEGKASPDIRYKVQHGCEQLNQRVIVEQTLLLFLFINFSDRFQSELLDLIGMCKNLMVYLQYRILFFIRLSLCMF